MTLSTLRKFFGKDTDPGPQADRTVVFDCSDEITEEQIKKIEDDVRPAIDEGAWEPVEECGW